jgi:hypothetical protein
VPKPTRRQRKRSTSEAAAELSSTTGGDSDTEPTITARDLQGLKFFKRIRPLLKSLHGIGTQRDKAGNRELHMDEYCVLVLMWMFNPVLTSMRGLQQASTLADVQRKFGVGRSSLGSLSESVSIFDPEPLLIRQ